MHLVEIVSIARWTFGKYGQFMAGWSGIRIFDGTQTGWARCFRLRFVGRTDGRYYVTEVGGTGAESIAHRTNPIHLTIPFPIQLQTRNSTGLKYKNRTR